MQQAAAEQLARRWPPAAGYSASEIAQQQRDAALAQLQERWATQYGKIDEAVAAAQLQAAGAVDKASNVVASAQDAVDAARGQVQDVQQLLTAYQQQDLPAAARQELAKSLEQLATSADSAVRIRAAQAMGATGDPAFMPALMTMLDDGTEVQAAAIASLEKTTGRDVAKTADGRAITTEERARAWQLWYREQMDQAAR
jgi:HEAT repeat protein